MAFRPLIGVEEKTCPQSFAYFTMRVLYCVLVLINLYVSVLSPSILFRGILLRLYDFHTKGLKIILFVFFIIAWTSKMSPESDCQTVFFFNLYLNPKLACVFDGMLIGKPFSNDTLKWRFFVYGVRTLDLVKNKSCLWFFRDKNQNCLQFDSHLLIL